MFNLDKPKFEASPSPKQNPIQHFKKSTKNFRQNPAKSLFTESPPKEEKSSPGSLMM